MQIALVLLLLFKVALFELKSTNHIHKVLMDDGNIFNLKDYPYVMSLKVLLLNKRIHACTGSLVTELFVLTAAHCVYGNDKKDLKVYQGTWIKNHDSRNVVKLYIHESYNYTTEVLIGDLSVLKIEKPFSHIKEYMRIGGFPIEFANNKSLECIVIGIGTINVEHEEFVNQIMVKHGRKACEGYDSVKTIDTWQQFICEIPSMHKTYEEDSGGPMICNGLQYGVCSFSINFNGGDMQTVYVFIDYYRKWINDIIEPVQSTSLTIKQKKMKKNKTNQKGDAKLIIPYHILYMILGILWYNEYYELYFN